MKNKKKLNNKGFSLVELIIVIAIMAVLIAVLAPQYMRFIERGRVASDRDNIKAIQGALEVYYVDPIKDASNNYISLKGGETIILNRGAVASASGGNTAAITQALQTAGLIKSGEDVTKLPQLTNQETFSKVTIKLEIDTDTKTANVTVTEEGTPAP